MKVPKPTSGPFTIPSAFVTIAYFGFGLWVRLLGKRAPLLVGAGFVAATILAVILNFVT